MANTKKSIIEEALLEAQAIDATFKSNAKEILAHTMSSEIEDMVKESLTGSKRKRLKEDEEDENETDLDLDLDTEEGEEDMDLDLDVEDGEGEEDMDLELDLDSDEEGEEDMDLDLDLDAEGGEGDEDLDLGGLDFGDDADLDMDVDMDMDLGGEEEGDLETVDLTGASDSDVISVFKKMGPEDEIEVVNDNGMVTLKDNRSGSEYRIELNPTGGVSNAEVGEMGLGENRRGRSEEVIYEIEVDDDDELLDYMEDINEIGAAQGEHDPEMLRQYCAKNPDASECTDNMDYMEDVEEDVEVEENEDYMSHTLKYRQFQKGGEGTRAGIRQESKTPQITKLIKENTNLNTKNTSLVSENKELTENHEKMVDALRQFRKKLQEVAVFNSNLTYAVRLFTENSTTKEEKQEILKRLDSAKDLKESQSIYKQLVKEYTSGKAPMIKESIDEKFNKTASSGAAQISEQSVFVHPELQNMKKLWEYGYKK